MRGMFQRRRWGGKWKCRGCSLEGRAWRDSGGLQGAYPDFSSSTCSRLCVDLHTRGNVPTASASPCVSAPLCQMGHLKLATVNGGTARTAEPELKQAQPMPALRRKQPRMLATPKATSQDA